MSVIAPSKDLYDDVPYLELPTIHENHASIFNHQKNPPPKLYTTCSTSGFFDVFRLEPNKLDNCLTLSIDEPMHPNSPNSTFINNKNDNVYVANAFDIFLWFNTHMHIIKQNAPKKPPYEKIQIYDEVTIAMLTIGTKHFPELSTSNKYIKDYNYEIRLSFSELFTVITRLHNMGIDMHLCTDPMKAHSCLCCVAYHALRQTTPF
tara:strand:+ start:197 stop:811 length:615 start_codon:yes stop_codon:yes gene_type:complete